MNRTFPFHAIVLLLAGVAAGPALAQHAPDAQHATPAPRHCPPAHAAMGHCTPVDDAPAADAPAQGHAGHAHPRGHAGEDGHSARPRPAALETCTPAHAAMGHCTPASPVPTLGHEPGHAGHDTADTSGCTPEHAAMGHCRMPAGKTPHDAHAGAHPVGHGVHDSTACPPAHAAMGHCSPATVIQPPREPIPAVTQADRDAAFPVLAHAHMDHAPATYTRVTFNRLEAWDDGAHSGQAWEAHASTGGDIHRLWLRSSGSRSGGRTGHANAELHLSRAVARWWDVVAGLRHDTGNAPSRTRAAFGVQGIAPYQFEVSAMAYLGEGGAGVELEAEYDLRFSNRLVLQPVLELELQARDDPARGTGSGLSSAEAGLRLRYEVTRRFAPYLGIAHERSFGGTADLRDAAGEASRETRLVAGVRLWF